jgi:hypothetical protein
MNRYPCVRNGPLPCSSLQAPAHGCTQDGPTALYDPSTEMGRTPLEFSSSGWHWRGASGWSGSASDPPTLLDQDDQGDQEEQAGARDCLLTEPSAGSTPRQSPSTWGCPFLKAPFPRHWRPPRGYPSHTDVAAEEVALSRTIVEGRYTPTSRLLDRHSPGPPALKRALVRSRGMSRQPGLLGRLVAYATVVGGEGGRSNRQVRVVTTR